VPTPAPPHQCPPLRRCVCALCYAVTVPFAPPCPRCVRPIRAAAASMDSLLHGALWLSASPESLLLPGALQRQVLVVLSDAELALLLGAGDLSRRLASAPGRLHSARSRTMWKPRPRRRTQLIRVSARAGMGRRWRCARAKAGARFRVRRVWASTEAGGSMVYSLPWSNRTSNFSFVRRRGT
jgi:hypothetical protein